MSAKTRGVRVLNSEKVRLTSGVVAAAATIAWVASSRAASPRPRRSSIIILKPPPVPMPRTGGGLSTSTSASSTAAALAWTLGQDARRS